METAITFVATVLIMFAFELLYEWIAKRFANIDGNEPAETMEKSMNDGCQTSLRMLGFGFLAMLIVWWIMSHVNE